MTTRTFTTGTQGATSSGLGAGTPRRPQGYVPASLTNLDTQDVVEFMFRPTELTFSKSVQWNQSNDLRQAKRGRNLPPPDFRSGDPITLELNLLFDTYDVSGDSKVDVRSQTKKLWDMALITQSRQVNQTTLGSPPKVRFSWGSGEPLIAVITSISETFILFLPDGMPVRSRIKIALRQADDVGKFPGQNPTSGGPADMRVHTVTTGETIDQIAYEAYGRSSAWRHVAAVNNLEDPSHLEPGRRLLLTPLP
jgi:hypothetical protein